MCATSVLLPYLVLTVSDWVIQLGGPIDVLRRVLGGGHGASPHKSNGQALDPSLVVLPVVEITAGTTVVPCRHAEAVVCATLRRATEGKARDNKKAGKSDWRRGGDSNSR